MANHVKHWSYFAKKSVSLTLSMLGNLHVTKTARELLFEGYKDELLSMIGMMPVFPVQDKFGLFYGVS